MLNDFFCNIFFIWSLASFFFLISVVVIAWAVRYVLQAKKTAWELSLKNRRIEQIVECINDVLWVGTADFDLLYYVNPAFEALWGYSCQKLYDNPMFWTACILPSDRQMVLGAIERYRSEAIPAMDLPHFRIHVADGQTRWIHARITSLDAPPGDKSQIAIAFKDITKSKDLMESETFGHTLFNEAPMGMAIQDFSAVETFARRLSDQGVTDLRGYLKNNPCEVDMLAEQVHFVDANPALVDLYKASGLEMVLGPLSRFLLEEDRLHFIEQVVKFANGEDYYEGEGRNVNFKGQSVHAIMRKVVLQRPENGLSKVLAQLVDVTSLKSTQKERESLSAQLQQVQKMEAIGTLAGGVAHDFNNILGIILGNAELALEELPKDALAIHKINEIQNAVERARAIVKQLLRISRKSGRRHTSIHLTPLIEESISFLRATIPATIDIETFLSVESDVVRADSTQIHQIMINLCTNASHAMEADGGLISIHMDNVTLKKKLPGVTKPITPGQYVRLTVNDTGMGIAEEIKEKIFKPFFTTKQAGKGTGMGLCMVQGIMEEHGGGILLESIFGKGTSFALYFPSADQPTEDEEKTNMDIPTGSEHVLFVDDESLIADLSEKMLMRLGYRVTSCTDAMQALNIFETQSSIFDLVVTDMAMPGLTGCQLIRRIRQVAPTMPVILCSGYIERVPAKEIESLAINSVIAKPISLKGLAIAVRQALDTDTVAYEKFLEVSG